MWFPGIDCLACQAATSCLACQAATSCLACQAATSGPINSKTTIASLPSASWKNVSLDFLGPIPTGEYLLAVMDDYSRFPEVEIVTSTATTAVIPKLNTSSHDREFLKWQNLTTVQRFRIRDIVSSSWIPPQKDNSNLATC